MSMRAWGFAMVRHRMCSSYICMLINFVYLNLLVFVFVDLQSKSTAIVVAGWSVHLNTLFPGQA